MKQASPHLRPETGIYREQLAEVDRDLAAGSITADQAALAKVEIQRRLIATTRAADMARPISNAWRTAALAAVTGFVALASVNLYGLYGHPESVTAERSVEAVSTAETAAPPAAGAVDAMIGKLAARLKASPGDADGWRMLGWSYFSTQRYSEAADAYGKAMALEPGNQSYRSAHAEALVQAQGGTVTDRGTGHLRDRPASRSDGRTLPLLQGARHRTGGPAFQGARSLDGTSRRCAAGCTMAGGCPRPCHRSWRTHRTQRGFSSCLGIRAGHSR